MVPRGVGSVPPGEANTAFPMNITTVFSPQTNVHINAKRILK